MKKTIVILAALLTMLSAGAQNQEKKGSWIDPYFSSERSTESVRWGVRAGLNVSGLKNNVANNVVATAFDDSRYVMERSLKAGFQIGLSVEIPILRNLFINTGLLYSPKGVNLKFVQDYSKSSEEGKYIKEYSGRMRLHYIEVPVLASYRYNFLRNYELQVNLGPYFAVAASGNVKAIDDYNNDTKISLMGNTTYSEEQMAVIDQEVKAAHAKGEPYGVKEFDTFGADNINGSKANYATRFDMGIQLGAGVTFKKKYFAGMSYEWGLVNINGKRLRPISNNSAKNHNFNLSVGYNF